MEALLACDPRPDAILFANDNLAADALLADQRAGVRMPEDMAIVGFGDYPFAGLLLPSLTTLRPPAQAIGEVAAQRVLQALGVIAVEGDVTRLNRLHCKVIERESS